MQAARIEEPVVILTSFISCDRIINRRPIG